MKAERQNLLLVTVGTGTAGQYSNVAEGIMSSIRTTAPDFFFLMPSISEDSVAVADLVREGLAQTNLLFHPADERNPYFYFSSPDHLGECLRDFKKAFNQIRYVYPHHSLALNPTSGTKQMTAAAVVASLEAGVDRLLFISGERADGVVKTGTERTVEFSPRAFMADRAAQSALLLMAHGAYSGAVTLLRPYSGLKKHHHLLAQMYAAWDRLDYRDAAACAARIEGHAIQSLRNTLETLADRRQAMARIGDLIAGAARWLDLGQPEESIVRLYRALEMMAKTDFERVTGLHEPYDVAQFEKAGLPPSSLEGIRKFARKSNRINLGLRQMLILLDDLHSPIGRLAEDGNILDLMDLRNESYYGHGTRRVDQALAARLIAAVRQTIARLMPEVESWVVKCRFVEAEYYLREIEILEQNRQQKGNSP